MAIKIIKSTDKITVSTLVMVVYGQPGAGKSSFGFTANNPLCLDFDKGAYRSKQRKDTLDITSWKDIIELMRSPDVLNSYETIIVDTAGRCLDVLTQYIISESPKFGNKNGNLTMQGWGELKILFTQWLKQLRLLGKDIILVAHEREEKEGDNTRKRPDMQGGSYAELLKSADLIGYLYMENNRRTIDFTPCDSFYAKNAANIEKQYVPSFDTEMPDYAARLLRYSKSELSNLGQESIEIAEKVREWVDTLEGATDASIINKIYRDVKDIPQPTVKSQVEAAFRKRIKELGLLYVREKDCFDPKPSDEHLPQEPQQQKAASQKTAPQPRKVAPEPIQPAVQQSAATQTTIAEKVKQAEQKGWF